MANAIKCLGTISNENIIENNKAVVNGVQHKLAFINSAVADSDILFPEACSGLKTYDSATGSVVEHASAAEAFEGLVTNGDFRNGLTGWTAGDAGAILSETGGVLKVTNNDNSTALASQTLSVTVGVSYTLSVSSGGGTAGARVFVGTTPNGVEDLAPQFFTDNATFTFTASSSTVYLSLSVGNSYTNSYQEYNSCSIMPATESVITSRQDFTFLESFHEKISDKDVVYPLGNVQYGASSWEGVTLSNTVVAQGYSAFGEWDTSTKGYGVVWSTLSDADKAKFLQDPENNIYNDDGELIQVRYRVRVVEGLGDEWAGVLPWTLAPNYLSYDNKSRPLVRGSSTSSMDYTNGVGVFGAANLEAIVPLDSGLWGARANSTNAGKAHNGLCFAVPIALVQRRNQGAYHPVYNPKGVAYIGRVGNLAVADFWYSTNATKPSSQLECFTEVTTNSVYLGNIGQNSGRPDSKFYDAIYASDVQDLRMSSKHLPLAEIREKYKRMAIAGEVRGYEGVPLIVPFISHASVGAFNNKSNDNTIRLYTDAHTSSYQSNLQALVARVGDIVFMADSVDYAFGEILQIASTEYKVGIITRSAGFNTKFPFGTNQPSTGMVVGGINKSTHKQASPTWTDIIGSPANIAATFPQGVEGQWIPVIPDGTSQTYSFNRKSRSTLNSAVRSLDGGTTWSTANGWGNEAVTNDVTSTLSASYVLLMNYTTQAHFTADDVNSKVLDLGGVWASGWNTTFYGNSLIPSLIGKVGTWGTSTPKGVSWSASLTDNGVAFGGTFDSAQYGYPSHANITLSSEGNTVKTLDYLSSTNNVAKLNYAYKEMVYDVDWGDNNQFEITNNQSTLTDDNGNTVKYGTASFNTQYFTVEE